MYTYIHVLLKEEVVLPYYVNIIGGLENQGPISRPEGFPDYQWIQCIRGKGRLLIDNKEFIITENMGIFLPPNVPHAYYSLEMPWETHFLSFGGEGVSTLLDLLGLKSYGIFSFDDIRFLDNIISDIYTTAKSKTISSSYKCSYLLYMLLIEIANNIKKNSKCVERLSHERLHPVIRYLEINYDKDISIDDMAEVIKVSPQFLCRLFSKALNMRPFSYLTNVRLQKAKEILINQKDISIKEVSTKVGYKDQSYFSAVFKKNEGLTPLEYKMLNVDHPE